MSNWVSLAVHVAVGLVLTPIIIRHVGKAGYGIWTVVYSFVGYYGLLNLGVRSAIMRYVARQAARGEKQALGETVGTASAMFLVTGVLVVVLSLSLAGPLSRFFSIEEQYRETFRIVVWVLGVSTAFDFLSSVVASVLAAYERYVVINVVNSLTFLGRAGVIVVALNLGGGIPVLAYATLGMAVATLIAKYTVCRMRITEVSFSFRAARWGMFKTLVGYGAATIIMTAVNLMRTKLDSIVIARWLDMEAVAVYGVAALIIQYLMSAINSGIGVMTPRFARLEGVEKQGQLVHLFLNSLFVGAVLAFGAGMAAFLFGSALQRHGGGRGGPGLRRQLRL